MHPISVLALAFSFFQLTHAHYRWTSLIANDTLSYEYEYVRFNTDYYNPITNVNSTDMTCNRGPVPANETAWVKAGSTVGFVLDRAIFHDGPINVYMANAPSAETAYSFDGKGSVWFKIADLGPTIDGTTPISWPSDGLTSFNFTIPARVPNGEYLIRAEQIGLHLALDYGKAEFYVSCAQIHVYGGGTGNPSPLVAIPGVYTGYEPGILVNIYTTPNYTIPGPTVWK